MQDRMSIPIHRDYNKIWKDFKISFFESYTRVKWVEELIDVNSITYEFMKEDVESLFYSTGGYLQYLDFESVYKLSIEVTALQVFKNISKNKKCFFERDNINNLDKYYLVKQRICNNCKNVFNRKRRINIVLLQSLIMDTVYENYEIDFTVLDVEKLSKNEPAKLIFAINKLLNNYDLNYEELIEITHKYNIDSSNFYILNFANQFRNLKKASNNQIVIDFMEAA